MEGKVCRDLSFGATLKVYGTVGHLVLLEYSLALANERTQVCSSLIQSTNSYWSSFCVSRQLAWAHRDTAFRSLSPAEKMGEIITRYTVNRKGEPLAGNDGGVYASGAPESRDHACVTLGLSM